MTLSAVKVFGGVAVLLLVAMLAIEAYPEPVPPTVCEEMQQYAKSGRTVRDYIAHVWDTEPQAGAVLVESAATAADCPGITEWVLNDPETGGVVP